MSDFYRNRQCYYISILLCVGQMSACWIPCSSVMVLSTEDITLSEHSEVIYYNCALLKMRVVIWLWCLYTVHDSSVSTPIRRKLPAQYDVMWLTASDSLLRFRIAIWELNTMTALIKHSFVSAPLLDDLHSRRFNR